MYQDNIAIFWLEAKWFKRYGKSGFRFINNRFDIVKETIADYNTIEKGCTRFVGKGNRHCIKLESTQLSLNNILSMHKKDP